MCQDDGSGIALQCCLDHFTWVDGRLGQGAGEQGFAQDQAVLRVQPERDETLLWQVGEAQAQPVPYVFRRSEVVAHMHFLGQRQFETGFQLRRLGHADTGCGGEFLQRTAGQPAQLAIVPAEEVAGQIDGTFAAGADA